VNGLSVILDPKKDGGRYNTLLESNAANRQGVRGNIRYFRAKRLLSLMHLSLCTIAAAALCTSMAFGAATADTNESREHCSTLQSFDAVQFGDGSGSVLKLDSSCAAGICVISAKLNETQVYLNSVQVQNGNQFCSIYSEHQYKELREECTAHLHYGLFYFDYIEQRKKRIVKFDAFYAEEQSFNAAECTNYETSNEGDLRELTEPRKFNEGNMHVEIVEMDAEALPRF